jgi:hypothetical protein
MRELNVVLPGVIWPEVADYAYLAATLAAPNLLALLSHARLSQESYCYSDFYYQQHASASSSLARTFASDVHSAQHAGFLLAEPTHLRADRDRLLIAEAELLQLNESEVTTIVAAINQHFHEELTIYPLSPELWLVGLNFAIDNLNSYPILDIVGANIDEYLPSGKTQMRIHQLINELQMLLFNLPLNQERSSQGLLPVNSLWLWDKVPRALPFKASQLMSNNPRLADCREFKQEELALADAIIVDSAYFPACYRDSYAWASAVHDIDASLGAYLCQKLMKFKLHRVNLWVPSVTGSICARISPVSLYAWWRHKSWAALAEVIHKLSDN